MHELGPDLSQSEAREGQLLLLALLACLLVEHALEQVIQAGTVKVVIDEQGGRVLTEL